MTGQSGTRVLSRVAWVRSLGHVIVLTLLQRMVELTAQVTW